MILGKIATMLEEGSLYKEAWAQLYNAFGERMQTKELELMDAVLQVTKLDQEEQQKMCETIKKYGCCPLNHDCNKPLTNECYDKCILEPEKENEERQDENTISE